MTDADPRNRITLTDASGTLWTRSDLRTRLSLNVRWTPMRKRVLATAVRMGMLTDEEATAWFAVSPEEIAGWERMNYGARGTSRSR